MAIMMTPAEQLPRIFQANLSRFFDRVIWPGMDALTAHPTLATGEAQSLEQFLDRAAAQVDNYTANEAAKSFVLTMAAIFERQLSIWARAKRPDDAPMLRGFKEQLLACAEIAEVDLGSDNVGPDLLEMFVVANIVRHGEGPACEKLRAIAPALWSNEAGDYLDLLPRPMLPSEHLRLRPADLIRYVRAGTRFWGRCDPLPGAVTEPSH